MNLEKMNRAQLLKLRADIDRTLKKLESRLKIEALKAAEKAARDHGFSLSELTGGKATKRKHPVSQAKYRNPDNADQTWTGRGRKPRWFADALKKGISAEKMEIK